VSAWKRVAAGIAGNRLGSAPRKRLGDPEGFDPSTHLARIEAQPRALSAAKPAGAKLIGMGIDPGAIDAAPLRDLGGAQHPARLNAWMIRPQQVGDPLGQHLNRLSRETNLLGVARMPAGLALVGSAFLAPAFHR
jgi:hypothetical protein